MKSEMHYSLCPKSTILRLALKMSLKMCSSMVSFCSRPAHVHYEPKRLEPNEHLKCKIRRHMVAGSRMVADRAGNQVSNAVVQITSTD